MPLNMKNILAAVKEVKNKSTKRKFSQSIELAINLQNIDMKKPEGRIQESIELPNPVGKERKVCVIASGEMALKAKKAGATLVIEKDDLEALKEGELYRFMDCLNFVKKGDEFVFDSLEHKKYKEKGKRIMHFLPVQKDLANVEVLMPDKKVVAGFGEPLMKTLKIGDIIQAERFGFMRLDKKEKDKLVFWYTHQ